MTTNRRAFSVAVFCRNKGDVLLIHHKRLDMWLPVGGEIEDGETPLEAARRELREETGLEGYFPTTSSVLGTPAGFLGYEEHLAGSKGLHMCFAFLADVESRDVKPNSEFSDWIWVNSMDAIVDLSSPPPANVIHFVRCCQGGGA